MVENQEKGLIMENFKKKQLYTMLNSRFSRLMKELEETRKGLMSCATELHESPEEQIVILRFLDDMEKVEQLIELMQSDIQLRKELVELKLDIENLASGKKDEEENNYW